MNIICTATRSIEYDHDYDDHDDDDDDDDNIYLHLSLPSTGCKFTGRAAGTPSKEYSPSPPLHLAPSLLSSIVFVFLNLYLYLRLIKEHPAKIVFSGIALPCVVVVVD